MWKLEHLSYRPASVALILLSFALPVAVAQLHGSEWIGFLLGLPLYLLLIVLTYRRLRNSGRSGGWIILMVLDINFGPRLEGPEPLVFHLSNLLLLVPVVLAWLPPRRARHASI